MWNNHFHSSHIRYSGSLHIWSSKPCHPNQLSCSLKEKSSCPCARFRDPKMHANWHRHYHFRYAGPVHSSGVDAPCGHLVFYHLLHFTEFPIMLRAVYCAEWGCNVYFIWDDFLNTNGVFLNSRFGSTPTHWFRSKCGYLTECISFVSVMCCNCTWNYKHLPGVCLSCRLWQLRSNQSQVFVWMWDKWRSLVPCIRCPR